ncbi:unnamed protein product [Phyllotreta striolata]|uniref:Uncharacterized protein n=1 Tax=Phyllotreta striolata TaxID=444603 RepID=A0A9N9TZL5_PHYSR|nr:unnamed protein product [Phyllotreta striolata]
MFAKISICVLLSVVLIESASSSAVPTNQQVDHPLFTRQLQLKEDAPATGNSFFTVIKNIITTVLNAIKSIVQSVINIVGCTILQPYMSLINVLRNILSYINGVITQYAPGTVETVDPIIKQINQALVNLNQTLHDLLKRISSMGCGV